MMRYSSLILVALGLILSIGCGESVENKKRNGGKNERPEKSKSVDNQIGDRVDKTSRESVEVHGKDSGIIQRIRSAQKKAKRKGSSVKINISPKELAKGWRFPEPKSQKKYRLKDQYTEEDIKDLDRYSEEWFEHMEFVVAPWTHALPYEVSMAAEKQVSAGKLIFPKEFEDALDHIKRLDVLVSRAITNGFIWRVWGVKETEDSIVIEGEMAQLNEAFLKMKLDSGDLKRPDGSSFVDAETIFKRGDSVETNNNSMRTRQQKLPGNLEKQINTPRNGPGIYGSVGISDMLGTLKFLELGPTEELEFKVAWGDNAKPVLGVRANVLMRMQSTLEDPWHEKPETDRMFSIKTCDPDKENACHKGGKVNYDADSNTRRPECIPIQSDGTSQEWEDFYKDEVGDKVRDEIEPFLADQDDVQGLCTYEFPVNDSPPPFGGEAKMTVESEAEAKDDDDVGGFTTEDIFEDVNCEELLNNLNFSDQSGELTADQQRCAVGRAQFNDPEVSREHKYRVPFECSSEVPWTKPVPALFPPQRQWAKMACGSQGDMFEMNWIFELGFGVENFKADFIGNIKFGQIYDGPGPDGDFIEPDDKRRLDLLQDISVKPWYYLQIGPVPFFWTMPYGVAVEAFAGGEVSISFNKNKVSAPDLGWPNAYQTGFGVHSYSSKAAYKKGYFGPDLIDKTKGCSDACLTGWEAIEDDEGTEVDERKQQLYDDCRRGCVEEVYKCGMSNGCYPNQPDNPDRPTFIEDYVGELHANDDQSSTQQNDDEDNDTGESHNWSFTDTPSNLFAEASILHTVGLYAYDVFGPFLEVKTPELKFAYEPQSLYCQWSMQTGVLGELGMRLKTPIEDLFELEGKMTVLDTCGSYNLASELTDSKDNLSNTLGILEEESGWENRVDEINEETAEKLRKFRAPGCPAMPAPYWGNPKWYQSPYYGCADDVDGCNCDTKSVQQKKFLELKPKCRKRAGGLLTSALCGRMCLSDGDLAADVMPGLVNLPVEPPDEFDYWYQTILDIGQYHQCHWLREQKKDVLENVFTDKRVESTDIVRPAKADLESPEMSIAEEQNNSTNSEAGQEPGVDNSGVEANPGSGSSGGDTGGGCSTIGDGESPYGMLMVAFVLLGFASFRRRFWGE